jgi:hypothetical protein
MKTSAKFNQIVFSVAGGLTLVAGMTGCEGRPQANNGPLTDSKSLAVKEWKTTKGVPDIYSFDAPENPHYTCMTKGTYESGIMCVPKSGYENNQPAVTSPQP